MINFDELIYKSFLNIFISKSKYLRLDQNRDFFSPNSFFNHNYYQLLMITRDDHRTYLKIKRWKHNYDKSSKS